jgi:hypothetical protein
MNDHLIIAEAGLVSSRTVVPDPDDANIEAVCRTHE